jgi:predicted PurR-regulated permease PerM
MKIFRICLEIHANPIIVKASVYTPASPAQRSLRTGLAILAAAAAIALLYYGRIFFVTLVIAAMIAYLLDPLVEFFMKLRMPRGLASFVACSISLLALYLVGLGLYNEGQLMLEDLPAYSSRINELVDGAAARVDEAEQRIYSTVIPRRFREGGEVPPAPPVSGSAASRAKKKKPESTEPPPIPEVRVRPETTPLVNYVYDYFRSYYSVFLMASFVPFLVYFILSWRDHLRSRLLAMFEGEARYTISKAMDGVAGMVRTYVVGNFMLGLLLSILSGILFALLKLPYTIVVAPLSGFLSLAPYIGLPLALIPPLIAALGAIREPAIYVALIAGVAVLHLLALNLLYPKFVGSRVHLNPLVGTLALMFWGMLWGAVGLLLAIPITAALKAVCDTVPSLRSYGRLLGD